MSIPPTTSSKLILRHGFDYRLDKFHFTYVYHLIFSRMGSIRTPSKDPSRRKFQVFTLRVSVLSFHSWGRISSSRRLGSVTRYPTASESIPIPLNFLGRGSRNTCRDFNSLCSLPIFSLRRVSFPPCEI